MRMSVLKTDAFSFNHICLSIVSAFSFVSKNFKRILYLFVYACSACMYKYTMNIHMCNVCISMPHISNICMYTYINITCIYIYAYCTCTYVSHVRIVLRRGRSIPLEICLRITVSHHMDFRYWFQFLCKKAFSHLPSQPSSPCFPQSNGRQDLVLSCPSPSILWLYIEVQRFSLPMTQVCSVLLPSSPCCPTHANSPLMVGLSAETHCTLWPYEDTHVITLLSKAKLL